MAPPKDGETASSEAIKTLVSLIASSSEFNPDYSIVAAEVGISHAKNVPRKLDSILKPYGYQIKSKKIVKIGENVPATPAMSATKPKVKAEPKTPGGTDSDEDEESNGSPVKKKTPAKKVAAPKEKKTPAKKAAAGPKTAKKRKIEEVTEDDSEDTEEKSVEDSNGAEAGDMDIKMDDDDEEEH